MVSLNKYDNGWDDNKPYENTRCTRDDNYPGSSAFLFAVEQRAGTKQFWYFAKAPDSEGNYKNGQYAFDSTGISPYNENDGVLERCRAVKEYMQAPTSFTLIKKKEEDADGHTIKSYDV